MKFHVNDNWWQDIFDEIYLLTDSRSVCNDELTRQEVDFIEQTLKVKKNSPILDLCGGQGRHSLELARRGYKNLTVFDYSTCLIELGKKQAGNDKLKVNFIQGDARKTGLPDEQYEFVLVMASSFGYFIDENENKAILNEIYRLLKLGGHLLLDLTDRDFCIQNFKPESIHNVDEDIHVKRERFLENDVIYSREIIQSRKKGTIRDSTYCIRLYSPDLITDLLLASGFTWIDCQRDFMNRKSFGDLGCMTNRMVVTGCKRC